MKKLYAFLMVAALSATVIATPDLRFSPGGTSPGGWTYTGADSTSGVFVFTQGIDIDSVQGNQTDALFQQFVYLPDLTLSGYGTGLVPGLGLGLLSPVGNVEIRDGNNDLLLSGTLASGSYVSYAAVSGMYSEITTDILVTYVDHSFGSAFLDTISEGMYFDFNLTLEASQNFENVIQSAGTASNGFSGSMTAIVPEPMTMALLGLGGILLRRRK